MSTASIPSRAGSTAPRAPSESVSRTSAAALTNEAASDLTFRSVPDAASPSNAPLAAAPAPTPASTPIAIPTPVAVPVPNSSPAPTAAPGSDPRLAVINRFIEISINDPDPLSGMLGGALGDAFRHLLRFNELTENIDETTLHSEQPIEDDVCVVSESTKMYSFARQMVTQQERIQKRRIAGIDAIRKFVQLRETTRNSYPAPSGTRAPERTPESPSERPTTRPPEKPTQKPTDNPPSSNPVASSPQGSTGTSTNFSQRMKEAALVHQRSIWG